MDGLGGELLCSISRSQGLLCTGLLWFQTTTAGSPNSTSGMCFQAIYLRLVMKWVVCAVGPGKWARDR